MYKKLLLSTFYACIVFCIISYATVMVSLLSQGAGPVHKPVTNIGFPFYYYEQFWTNGADAPNWGWNMNYFVMDFLMSWVATALVYFACKRKRWMK